MQKFQIIIHTDEALELQECVESTIDFMQHLTPRRREKVQVVLLTSAAAMPLVEQLREYGLSSQFRLVKSTADLPECEAQDTTVWVLTGELQSEWLLHEMCRRSRMVIHYRGKLRGKRITGGWYLTVNERHPLDRKHRLSRLFNTLYQDPAAIRLMRRQSKGYYKLLSSKYLSSHMMD